MNRIHRKPLPASGLAAAPFLAFRSSTRAVAVAATKGANFAAALVIALRQATCGLLCWMGFGFAAHAQSISVTHDGPASGSTCTLAQAINAANAANGVLATVIGSATVAGNCSGAAGGPNTISIVNLPTITLSAIDNYWYGPNALPPIASTIVIGTQRPATEKGPESISV